MDKILFGKRLNVARKSVGLSLRDLANRLNSDISHTALAKYEKGIMFPSTSILISLSKVLNLPIDYFYKEIHPIKILKDADQSLHMGKRDRSVLLESIRSSCEDYIFLASKVGYEFKNKIEESKEIDKGDLFEISRRAREVFGLGFGEIRNLIHELEFSGIITVMVGFSHQFLSLPLKTNKFRVIAINKNLSALDRRYYLAFEVGRHILGANENKQTLHLFAISFLLPDTRIKELIGTKRNSVSKEEINQLKVDYGVSIKHILELAYNLHIISRRKYQSLKGDIISTGEFISQDKAKLKLYLKERLVSKSTLEKLAPIIDN